MDIQKQKYFFLSKRLVFMGSPEGPRALTEEQLTAETQGERAEALTLDDSENPAKANADHRIVSDYMGQVNTKLRSIVSEAGIKDVPTIKAEKLAINGKYINLKEIIDSIPSGANPLDSNAKATLAVIHGLVEHAEIVAAINEEGSTGESVKRVANNVLARLEKEKNKANAEDEATTQTDKAGTLVRDRLQKLAIDTIQEKQEARFEQAKLEFISAKIAEVYPDQNEDNVGEKGRCLFTHLQGLLSNADFTEGLKDKDASVFTKSLNGINNADLKIYIYHLTMDTQNIINKQKQYLGENAAQLPKEVRAYIDGLIASNRANNQHIPWIVERIKGLDPINLQNVQQALSGYHIDGITDFENKAGSGRYESTVKQINENPEVQLLYRQRMAECLRHFGTSPNGPDEIAYRSYFLAQVARMGADDINKIRAIPSPDLWANRADTLNALPKGSRPATALPAAVVNVATRMAQRCRASGAEEGQVYAFTHGEKIYYAVYGGGGNVTIHDVPGGADMSSEMPPDAAGGERSVGASPDTSTVRQRKRSGAGGETGESLTENEGVALFKQQLLSRMSALRQEVKDGKVNDVGTLAIHLDTAIRAAASGIKNLTTMVTVGGQQFNITVPKSGSPMVSGDANAAAIVIFNSTPRTAVSTETPQSPENLRNSARGTVRSILGIKQSVGEMQAQINSSLTTAQKSALTTDDNGVRRVFQQRRIVEGGTLTLTAQINTNNHVSVTSRPATPEETARYDNAVKAIQAKRASA